MHIGDLVIVNVDGCVNGVARNENVCLYIYIYMYVSVILQRAWLAKA